MPEQLGFQFDGGAKMPPIPPEQTEKRESLDPRLETLAKIQSGEITNVFEIRSFLADNIPNFTQVDEDCSGDIRRLTELAGKAIQEDIGKNKYH